ncbi:hypothetical protein BGX33_004358 [Mortierella sp. NVP41]|nr:hypothetical protein BGX33_004358 [Mortierella sp. NVP41]
MLRAKIPVKASYHDSANTSSADLWCRIKACQEAVHHLCKQETSFQFRRRVGSSPRITRDHHSNPATALSCKSVRAFTLDTRGAYDQETIRKDSDSQGMEGSDNSHQFRTPECDYSTSQQQFWESISVLARSSVARMGKVSGEEVQIWQRAIASAVLGVYLRQSQESFLRQVEFMAQSPASSSGAGMVDQGADGQLQDKQPLISDAEFLSRTMMDSLLLMLNKKRAMDLYEALGEHSIAVPIRYLGSLVRIAVSQVDGYLLERIGNLLLNNEAFFQGSPQAGVIDSRCRTRPMDLSAKLMDSFVHGACENELYELARAVFDRTLDAGQKYRVSTFNKILDSYSVKGFGFDIVAAAEAESKKARRRRNSSRGKNDTSGSTPIKGQLLGSGVRESVATKAIAVADPKDITKYVLAMKDQGVTPNIVTLNVLVKLYLEMAQYKVAGAPTWISAFKTYNPAGLKPDLVTNNTLLAYYEKHKDLATMKKIYESMAGVPTTVPLSKRDRRLQAKMSQNEAAEGQPEDTDGEQPQPQQPQPQQTRPIRSNRDIYTYNTMLHALLQHAAESKDIASIGQCFYDMEQDGISADTVTFNTNILYHITGGNLSSAAQVFRSMDRTPKKLADSLPEQDIDPLSNPLFARSLSRPVKSVPSYSTRSSPGQAVGSPKSVFTSSSDDASSSPVADPAPAAPAPDVVTLTSLISGFGQANQMKKATQFFKEMTERYKIQPNLKTYSTLVAGLHRVGAHRKAEKLWDIVLEDIPASSSCGSSQQPLTLGESLVDDGDEDDVEQVRSRTLTIMERRQVEARRKLYSEKLKG